ncbi:MAG TPA: hypothetical protein VHA07_07945 [Devosia sp.]|nr:hypothetical protein [Devosia sp.]
MHIVINRLKFKAATDWNELRAKIRAFGDHVRAEPDFISIELLKIDEVTGAILVRYRERASLDRASAEIAGPWFAANMRQYLDGPADRVVGEVVATG